MLLANDLQVIAAPSYCPLTSTPPHCMRFFTMSLTALHCPLSLPPRVQIIQGMSLRPEKGAPVDVSVLVFHFFPAIMQVLNCHHLITTTPLLPPVHHHPPPPLVSCCRCRPQLHCEMEWCKSWSCRSETRLVCFGAVRCSVMQCGVVRPSVVW